MARRDSDASTNMDDNSVTSVAPAKSAVLKSNAHFKISHELNAETEFVLLPFEEREIPVSEKSKIESILKTEFERGLVTWLK